jgi:hypothetical protein
MRLPRRLRVVFYLLLLQYLLLAANCRCQSDKLAVRASSPLTKITLLMGFFLSLSGVMLATAAHHFHQMGSFLVESNSADLLTVSSLIDGA